MSSIMDTKDSLVRSSLWGVVRGLSVHTLIFPLEVIKIRQQCSQNTDKSIKVALALFKEEGIGGFYKGIRPQLLRTSLKQLWCWPMITGVPVYLQRFELGDLQKQTLTGLSIAAIDAAITTPLERAKIVSVFTRKGDFSLKSAYKEGWRGFNTHFSKLSVNWVAFLTAQKYLRDQSGDQSGKSLSLPQLAKIGTQVALIVSLVSAPFDIANTLKQAQNLSPSHLFSRSGVSKLYRGWPLNALSLVIHNIASVTLIDRLSRS